MELRSLTEARITTGDHGREAGAARGWRARIGSDQQAVLSAFHNVFFTYQAVEVRVRLPGDLCGEGLCRRADEVLFEAGWGTAAWSSPGPGRWQAPAFDLFDPDMPFFLEHALVGGKLYLTRHAQKIGRYLDYVGGPDLLERFTAGIVGERPEMAASLDRAWQR